MAECASINNGLRIAARNAESLIPSAAPFELGMSGTGSDVRELMAMTPRDIKEFQQDASRDLKATRRAAGILRQGFANAYDKALRTLRADSRDWFLACIEDEEYPATAVGLAAFITEHLEPACIGIEKQARHHDAIKAQTLGEGLHVHRLDKLSRYETHLDRKFERTLAMLVKLKQLRSGMQS